MRSSVVNIKVMVVGDSGVGKTELIKRYLLGNRISSDEDESDVDSKDGDSNFSHDGSESEENELLSMTNRVGADFVTKNLHIMDKDVSLQIWDTVGHPDQCFQYLGDSFFRGLNAIVLVFSIRDRSSFENLNIWYEETIKRVTQFQNRVAYGATSSPRGNTPEVIVLASKCDELWAIPKIGEVEELYEENDDILGYTKSNTDSEENIEPSMDNSYDDIYDQHQIPVYMDGLKIKEIEKNVRLKKKEKEKRLAIVKQKQERKKVLAEMERMTEDIKKWCEEKSINSNCIKTSSRTGLGLISYPDQPSPFDVLARTVMIGRGKRGVMRSKKIGRTHGNVRASSTEPRSKSFYTREKAKIENPPEWVEDRNTNECTSCGRPFTFFFRRHHCRKCGKVFCDSCTNARKPIPEMNYISPVRVCSECIPTITSKSKRLKFKRGNIQKNKHRIPKLRAKHAPNRSSHSHSVSG